MIVAPGKYRGTVVKAGIMAGKTNPQVFMEFETADGTITWFGSVTEKSKEISIKALLAAGYSGQDWNGLTNGMKAFTPREVNLVVEEETYQDKARLKVKWVNEISESKFESMNASQITVSDRGLFQKLRAESGNGKPKTGSDENPF